MFRSKIPRMFNYKKGFLKKGKDAEVPKKQGLLSVCAGIYARDRWFANFWKGKASGKGCFYSKSGDVCFGHFHDGWRHDHFLCIGFDGARSVYSIHYGTPFNLNRSSITLIWHAKQNNYLINCSLFLAYFYCNANQ